MLRIPLIYENEKGAVLVVALAFIVILGMLGATAVLITTTDMKIGGNYKFSEQVFYAAESGLEEARARMKGDAPSLIQINDLGYENDILWKAYIGTLAQAQELGFVPSAWEERYTGISAVAGDFDYAVRITHHNDGINIWRWGDVTDDGVPERTTINNADTRTIYLVTSYYNSEISGANDTVEIEMTRLPPITAPGALYVEAPTDLAGTSTEIQGLDSCGTDHRPGVVSTLPNESDVDVDGNVTVTGSPDPVALDQPDMDINALVVSYAQSADFYYGPYEPGSTISKTGSGVSISGGDADPGPGDGWGVPTGGATASDPSSCPSSDIKIIHWDMVDDDNNVWELKLSAGVTGCGVLLVEGDIEVTGGFSWYGLIIATGSIKFAGGGASPKNITGAVMAGGSIMGDFIGGNAHILWCSSAINSLLQNKAFRRLSWKEEM